jgi:hypothetical protein
MFPAQLRFQSRLILRVFRGSDWGVCRMVIRSQAFVRGTVRRVFGDPDLSSTLTGMDPPVLIGMDPSSAQTRVTAPVDWRMRVGRCGPAWVNRRAGSSGERAPVDSVERCCD